MHSKIVVSLVIYGILPSQMPKISLVPEGALESLQFGQSRYQGNRKLFLSQSMAPFKNLATKLVKEELW